MLREDGKVFGGTLLMETKKHDGDARFRCLGGVECVFEPTGGGQQKGKKHPCPDCSFCQGCAETRCLTCRSERNRGSSMPRRKLSIQEQILLYEELNRKAREVERAGTDTGTV